MAGFINIVSSAASISHIRVWNHRLAFWTWIGPLYLIVVIHATGIVLLALFYDEGFKICSL